MIPIRSYTYQTPNGREASIMLEGTGLPYEVRVVDVEEGEQRTPAFLALSPNGKIPVVDDPDRGGRAVFESGAILLHFAERSGVLGPAGGAARTTVLHRALFQAAHVGPALGQPWNFEVLAEERIPGAVARSEREAARVHDVLDGDPDRRPHPACGYGVADVMTWPWIHAAAERIGFPVGGRPDLARWYAAIPGRPAVRRGLAVPRLPDPRS